MTMEFYGDYNGNLWILLQEFFKYGAIRSVASTYKHGHLENTHDIFTDYHHKVWKNEYGNNRQMDFYDILDMETVIGNYQFRIL